MEEPPCNQRAKHSTTRADAVQVAVATVAVAFMHCAGHIHYLPAFAPQIITKSNSPVARGAMHASRALGSPSAHGSTGRSGAYPNSPSIGRSVLALITFAGGMFGRPNKQKRGRDRACIAQRARGGEDYYDTLGVSRSASDRDIKTAFRKLARQWHPDVNKEPGAQEKFQSIAKAYEILSDPQKRQMYDQFGEAGVSGMGGMPGGGMGGMGLEDLLSQVFGGGLGGMGGMGGMGGRRQQRSGPQRGSDLKATASVTFMEACFGEEKKISVRREEVCEECSGSGSKPGATKAQCAQCGGQGVVMQVVQTPFGVMQSQSTCPSCNGDGIDPSSRCSSCSGKGTQAQVKTVTVKVPQGCDNQNVLRVRGEGDKGQQGAPAGDLYLTISVEASSDFVREQFDIYTEASLSAYDVMLGSTIPVNTIDGGAEIKIPAGTQPGTKMRLKARGVPVLGMKDKRGDHYVTINVEIPRKLPPEDIEQIKKLRDAEVERR